MKINSILFFCILLILPHFSVAQKKSKNLHNLKKLAQNFVRVNETVYACKYETTNLDYLLFLRDVQGRMNPAIYQSLLPDTAKWRDPGSYNEPFVENYLRHPAYAQYPLVNISYEQANFYCTWLTQQFNNNPKRPYKKAVFKLPSRTEWQQAAAGGNSHNKFPWGISMDSLPKGMVVNYCPQDYHTKIWQDSLISNEGKKIPSKDSLVVYTQCKPYGSKTMYTQEVNLKQAKQNEMGLYHIAGNVSEMISTKGDCAGGNYRSRTDWLRVDAPNEFYPAYIPCPLIGFRVFMQVLEK